MLNIKNIFTEHFKHHFTGTLFNGPHIVIIWPVTGNASTRTKCVSFVCLYVVTMLIIHRP